MPHAHPHPFWTCGLRPFFSFAALSACLTLLVWLLFLGLGLPVAGSLDPFVWHAHEMLFGFALAALCGFLLTVTPVFTDTDEITGTPVRRLALLWLLARIAFWSSVWFGPPALLVSGLAHLTLLGGLAWLLGPRLWPSPHQALVWGLAALTTCILGFYFEALFGTASSRWLTAALGVFMALIVLALSRVSMRIVNAALAATGGDGQYTARVPRRRLAILGIALYTTAEFFHPGAPSTGWLALAAALAILNLMRDWWIGPALWRRLPLMLFGVYVLMAAGYALIGLSLLLEAGTFSAGRHLLTTGAMGVAIYSVMSIAGRAHCGYGFDPRRWVPAGAFLLVLAAVLRACGLLLPAGMLWIVAFALYAAHMLPLFLASRPDGLAGCKGTALP